MGDRYKHDLFKELYYNELEIKEKIVNRINFALGMIMALSGGIIFIINELITNAANLGAILFWISLIVISASYMVSILLLFKAYFKYSYEYIPPSSEIDTSLAIFEDYYDENTAYFESIGKNKEEVVYECLEKNMIKVYCQAATNNRSENLRKNKWLRWFSWSICILLVFLLLDYILILFVDVESECSDVANNFITYIVRR